MRAPEGLVLLIAIASFLAAIAVSMMVSVRSSARGDSLILEWWKRIFYGSLAMIGVWVIYFMVGIIAGAAAQ